MSFIGLGFCFFNPAMEVAVSSAINTVSGGVALLPYIPEFETQAIGSLLSSPGIIRVSD